MQIPTQSLKQNSEVRDRSLLIATNSTHKCIYTKHAQIR